MQQALIHRAHVEIEIGFDPKYVRTYSTVEKVIAKVRAVQVGMAGNANVRIVPVVVTDDAGNEKIRYTAYFYSLRELGRDMHRVMHAGFTVHN
jgi:hypothetical protein